MVTVCGGENVTKANTNNRQSQSEQQTTTHKLYFKTMDSEFGCIAMFLIKIILTLSRGLKFQYVI